jgi:hypothetical protein
VMLVFERTVAVDQHVGKGSGDRQQQQQRDKAQMAKTARKTAVPNRLC